MGERETIVAISTPAGRGAIGIVRLSGSHVEPVVHRLFRPRRAHGSLKDRRLHVGEMLDRSGEPIDEGMMVWMAGPRSYTGEDVVELHCHGNPTM